MTFSKDKAVVMENRSVFASLGLRGESDYKGIAQRSFLGDATVVCPALDTQIYTCVKICRTAHQKSQFYCMIIKKLK